MIEILVYSLNKSAKSLSSSKNRTSRAPWPNGKALLSGGKDCGFGSYTLHISLDKNKFLTLHRVPLVSLIFFAVNFA